MSCPASIINSRSEKKQKKKAEKTRKIFFVFEFMTRFFGNSAALYTRDRLYTSTTYTHTEQKIFCRSKDGANIIHSLHREYFYFFFRSLFFPPRARRPSRGRDWKKKKRIGFSFLVAALLIGFLTSIRFFQSSFLHRHAHRESTREDNGRI